MKKVLSMAVVFCLLASLFSGLTISVSAAGDGTESNPYQIATAANLSLVAENPSAYFVQTADITGVTSPITDASVTFTGSYDGGNYSIAVALPSSSRGLFTSTNGATISNLTVTGTVATDKAVQSTGSIGAFAGSIRSTSFINCTNEAIITGNATKVGGIAGSNDGGHSIFTNCKNEGTVTINNYFVAGILGYSADAATVEFTNCANTVNIKGSTYVVAGLLGQGAVTMTNCYNTGDILGFAVTNRFGGLVGGVLGNVSLTNCYNTGDVPGAKSGALVGGTWSTATTTLTNCYNIGTIATTAADQDLIGSHLQGSSTHTKNFVNCYTTGASTTSNVTGSLTAAGITAERLNTGAAAGEEPYQLSPYYSHPILTANPEPAPAPGTEANPYQIATIGDLSLVAQDPTAYFVQTADIEEEVTSWINGSTTFSGNYDGRGHFINVNIESKNQSVGLFSKVTGTISNVIVKGKVKGHDRAGGVVGELQKGGAVINCVNYAAVDGYQGIAGIVGCALSGGNSIQGCKNFGTIIGTGQYDGGIIGYGELGSLSGCANYGNVTGGSTQVGGIAGYIYCSISNCLNAGNVTGNSDLVGGIAGQFRNTSMSNCYNLGIVTTNYNNAIAGGLIAGNYGVGNIKVSNCYNAGVVFAPNGTAANMAINSKDSTTFTYENCYALTTDLSATAPAGVTLVDKAGLKNAIFGLGGAYEIGTLYEYPQLSSNPMDVAWDFGKLTVTGGENGTVSFTGSMYLKQGSVYQLKVEPIGSYVAYVDANGEDQLVVGNVAGITVGEDTVVTVTFEERRPEAPSFVEMTKSAYHTGKDGVVFAKVLEGYGYEITGWGIEYSLTEDFANPQTLASATATWTQYGVYLDFAALDYVPATYYVRPYVLYSAAGAAAEKAVGAVSTITK